MTLVVLFKFYNKDEQKTRKENTYGRSTDNFGKARATPKNIGT